MHRPTAQRRARLLARRRRMVTLLFVAFALGAVVAAVAGFAFIWVPALPAVLLTFYIGHLRRLERQRYEVKLDRTRAAQAAERLRARERAREQERAAADERPSNRRRTCAPRTGRPGRTCGWPPTCRRTARPTRPRPRRRSPRPPTTRSGSTGCASAG
ncbi:hypothetical protein ACFQ1I_26630 [Kitasatospora arboriphila]